MGRFAPAVALAGSVALGACGRRLPAAEAPGRSRAPVEWAGCAVVRVGPRCELGAERRLTLWSPAEDMPRWTFAADGHPLRRAAAESVQGGWRVALDVPRMTRRLSATQPEAGGEVWSLAVGDAVLHPEIDGLVLAGKKGDPDAAQRLREMIDRGDPPLRARAQAGYARVMLARGDAAEAEPALRSAMRADRAEGRLSDEMRDGSVLIWALAALQQRFADARAVLQSLVAARDQFPEGRTLFAYSEGLLAGETDDLRTALASYRAAAHGAERLARVGFADYAAEDVARILVTIGRADEAISILDLLPPKPDPCARASFTINRVDALLGAAVGNGSLADGRIAPALAQEQRATGECRDPHRHTMAAVHALRYAMAIGDGRTAEKLVAPLRAEPEAKDALVRAWRADVLGVWWLERGRAADALGSFNEEAAVARAAGLRDERFRAEVGAGRALLARGLRSQGIARLKVAEALQERTFEGIPIAEGRGEFLASRDEAVRLLVDALVAEGAVGEAMTVARTARATELGRAAKLDRLGALSPAQRRQWDLVLERRARIRQEIEQEATEDWKLPAEALTRVRADREIRADEARDALDAAYRLLVDHPSVAAPALAAPGPGQLQLVFFPATKDWIAFTRTSADVHARRFSDRALDSDATAGAVLDLLSPDLAAARDVQIFSFGRSDRIDWHAVAWRGEPLISSRTVEYSLDLAGGPDRACDGSGANSALVVADPTGDLRAASGEADLVAHALGAWRVSRLDGAAATRDSLLKILPDAELFHYAGHAEIAGPSGSSSALVLAGGARAQLGDLMALPRLPGLVVLSACRAAATGATLAGTASASTMGLAQAFLAAGSRAAVAPTREVADTEAQEFMTTLYLSLTSRCPAGVAQAFRRAAIQAVGRTSESFRLIIQ